MSYEPTVWDENTPITPARLNNLETQYNQAVTEAEAAISNLETAISNIKLVKSIQTDERSMADGERERSVTINAVDITKSIAFIGSITTNGADTDSQNVIVYLDDSTTLKVEREVTTGKAFVRWYVIEFY